MNTNYRAAKKGSSVAELFVIITRAYLQARKREAHNTDGIQKYTSAWSLPILHYRAIVLSVGKQYRKQSIIAC